MREKGFIYMDALLSVTIFLLFIPSFLFLLTTTIKMIDISYERDYIVQHTSDCIETVKSYFYESGEILDIHELKPYGYHQLDFQGQVENVTKEGIHLYEYTVHVYRDKEEVYQISTYFIKGAYKYNERETLGQ